MSATVSPRRRAPSTPAKPRNGEYIGEASSKEVKSLVADGVPVAPLPPKPPKPSEVN